MSWFSKWGYALLMGGALGAALWTAPVAAETGWETMVPPNTGGGLVLSPHIIDSGSGKPFMVWAGTGVDASFKQPEFTFSVLRGNEWNEPKAPFFGNMVGNVRCISACLAKYTVGTIFMRNAEDDKNSFEVLYTISSDRGWSFSKPAVADSFHHEDTAGTAVACAGVGGKKPMFSFGWLAESRAVKVSLWNPSERMDRPRAETVGRYGRGYERLGIAGEAKGGFVIAWNDGTKLMSKYLKPLVGSGDDATPLIEAKVGNNFDLTDYRGHNPKLVVELSKLRKADGARRQVWAWEDGAWKRIPAAAPPKGEKPTPSRLEACQDEKGDIFVATLPRSGDSILYSRLLDGKFTDAEVAMELKPVIGVTGFDIARVEDYVYITVCQGPYLNVVRRKV